MNKREHLLVGFAAGAVASGVMIHQNDPAPTEAVLTAMRVTAPVVLGSLLPDIDTEFGTHRKTLHNLAVLAVVAAYPILFGTLRFVWIGVLSHYLLDLVTGARGMALFYPLSSSEYGIRLPRT